MKIHSKSNYIKVHMATRWTIRHGLILLWFKDLRTSLCKNQTSWEMKIFNPLQILVLRWDAQKRPFKRSQHSCCHGNDGCLFEAEGLIFIQKRRKNRVKCLFLCLKLNTTLQNGTSTIHRDIIRLHFYLFNFPLEWMWTH